MLILVGYTVVITNGGFIHFLLFVCFSFLAGILLLRKWLKKVKTIEMIEVCLLFVVNFVICTAAFVHILSLCCSLSLVFMKEDSHEVFNNKINLSHFMEVG